MPSFNGSMNGSSSAEFLSSYKAFRPGRRKEVWSIVSWRENSIWNSQVFTLCRCATTYFLTSVENSSTGSARTTTGLLSRMTNRAVRSQT